MDPHGPAPDLDLRAHLRPGDTVVVGQVVAEPPTLVGKLLEAARELDGVTALCGYTLSPVWADVTPGHPLVRSYVAHGALRRLGPDALDMLPLHMSRMADHFASGRLAADVVLLQTGPADARGDYDLGAAVDYVAVAARHARAVLVEVNANMPRTRSAYRLPGSLVTAAMGSTRPLAVSSARRPNPVERRVAANVAALVPDGAVLQLGVSALADAVAAALHTRRGLRVRSGLVGDWLVGLAEAGALEQRPGAVVAGMALGGPELYAFLDGSTVVEFAPTADQVGPTDTAAFSPFLAINAAVQVDLCGQVNAEVAGGRYVGAVGGQVDFFRAAQRSPGGAAVAALASTAPDGSSRIVPRLTDAMVTSLKSDVDIVVTEWGAADIRACSLAERAAALARVAHPDHRAALADPPS